MILGADGRHMICDGDNCTEIADVLVAFHPELMKSTHSDSVAEGWLFEIRQGFTLNFCPSCARKRLKQIGGISI